MNTHFNTDKLMRKLLCRKKDNDTSDTNISGYHEGTDENNCNPFLTWEKMLCFRSWHDTIIHASRYVMYYTRCKYKQWTNWFNTRSSHGTRQKESRKTHLKGLKCQIDPGWRNKGDNPFDIQDTPSWNMTKGEWILIQEQCPPHPPPPQQITSELKY